MKKALVLAMALIGAPAGAHTGPHVDVFPVTGIKPDADFSDWPKDIAWHEIASSDPQSFSAKFAVGLDRARGMLNVAIHVKDDIVVLEGPGMPWNAQDGISVYVDANHGAGVDQSAQFFVHKEFGFGNPMFEGTGLGVRRISGHDIYYEFEIDVAKLRGARGLPAGDAVIGFDLVVLDRDGPEKLKHNNWTPGELKWAVNSDLGDAWLLAKPGATQKVAGQTAWVGIERAKPPGFVHARRRGTESFFIRIPVDKQGRFTLELPPGEYEFRAADARSSETMSAPIVRRVDAAAALALPGTLEMRPLKGALDTLMPKLLAEYNVRATQVAVIENGKIAVSRAWGVDRNDKPATRETAFRIASITKPITTMTVLTLVERGTWNLDEPLAKYWVDPDLTGDERHELLTSRLALQHRTGLPNWREGKLVFTFTPGERMQYSGEGLEWMRRALEKATGESLETLASRHVFGPAKMTHSTYVWPAWVGPRYAGEYTGAAFVGYENGPEPNAAANVMSTAEDLARFGLWVMNGGGLSQATWRQLEDTSANDGGKQLDHAVHGLGWAVTRDGPKRDTLVIHHGGGQSGINAELFLVPSQKRGLVVLTNGTAGGSLLLGALNSTLNARGEFPRLAAMTEERARD